MTGTVRRGADADDDRGERGGRKGARGARGGAAGGQGMAEGDGVDERDRAAGRRPGGRRGRARDE